ncbi:hypothetical protein [Aeromonas veronii]|uniref:hypothetical protein n=1 Tax=Aeromonas veronii TaxID=654 RepID=UPI000EAFD797|nr:hypothetical protein [Aeromonas veronii]AYK20495.1 hypothetical protein C0073_022525 [Aeromonas veronii]
MYGWLRHEGFSPEWDTGERDGKHHMGITIPVHEVPQLRIFQKTNPARWGNHPDVAQAMKDNQREIEEQSKINREKLAKLTPEQRDWIEVIHYETHLHLPQALELNERLHELAAQHFKLAHMDVSESGLSKRQEQAREAIEQQITELLDGVPNVKGPHFVYDPRGTTVGVKFESGRADSITGSYKVPLNPERVKALGDEPFWDAYPAKTEYVVLTIEETGNAAFVDLGRDQEVARIIDEAADKIASHSSIGDADFALRDVNGNRVGRVEITTVTPTGDVPDGTVRLAIETGNAAFEHDANLEVSLLLRGAAEKVRDGEHVFALHDTNGNMVGKFEYREEPSLAKDGVIDMNEAMNSGRVYLAEDGWSGIADGEYRFIVTAPDFEPGYGQGEGDVWLVNAKGEIADGYESPQSVRETLFRELNRDEKSDLRAVVEGACRSRNTSAASPTTIPSWREGFCMGTQKLYQISFSSADAKAALKTLIPAMESGFNVNTHRAISR